MDRMFCPRCRNEIAVGAATCFSCGSVLRLHSPIGAAPIRATDRISASRKPLLLTIGLVTLLNSVFWCFISLFAVTGDGGSEGIKLLWRIGFSVIGFLTILSFVLLSRRFNFLAVLSACLQVPTIFLALYTGHHIERTIAKTRESPPELTAACRDAGVDYLAQSAAPVRSIAYDWPTGSTPPYYTHFRLDDRGNLSDLQYSTAARIFPSQIEYVESRCCRENEMPSSQISFKRWVGNSFAAQSASEITADVLVELRRTDQAVSQRNSRLSKVETVVTDRRDGRILAILRYAYDQRNGRGCGLTSPGMMDEREFVMKAVGIGVPKD